tara:strand:- start:191 stop:382 length:192 start_codon:yes stop_codon:yes gene_type:complete
MKVGDLVVHIGAKPSGYRIRLVCDIKPATPDKNQRKVILFVDGRYDYKDCWRVFNGWKKHERR